MRTLIIATTLLVLTHSARATEHLWEMTELFSDATGTIQFIEMTNVGADFQNNLNRAFFHSEATGNMLLLDALPSNTAFKSVTAATRGAADLLASQNPGSPQPDFILPDNFFDTTADTVSYVLGDPADPSFFFPLNNAHQEFGPGEDELPLDGLNSLQYEITGPDHLAVIAPNTLRTFALNFGDPAFQINAVPEPAAAGLLLIGATTLAGRRRRY